MPVRALVPETSASASSAREACCGEEEGRTPTGKSLNRFRDGGRRQLSAGLSKVLLRGPPGTRTLRPRVKSPLLYLMS